MLRMISVLEVKRFNQADVLCFNRICIVLQDTCSRHNYMNMDLLSVNLHFQRLSIDAYPY